MASLSKIYNVARKRGLRGKAKQGYVRPTIKQFFTSKNYTDTPK